MTSKQKLFASLSLPKVVLREAARCKPECLFCFFERQVKKLKVVEFNEITRDEAALIVMRGGNA